MKILVALDGTALAEEAIAPAVALASLPSAELVFLTVFSPFVDMSHYKGSHDERLAQAESERNAYLEEAGKKATGVDKIQFMVAQRRKTEDSDECIARVARESAADILVVASKRAATFSGFVLGSTAQGLVRLGPCPVLVVPARQDRKGS